MSVDRRRRARGQIDPARAPGAEREDQLGDEDDRDQRAERQIAHETGAQLGEIDVEHHHDEQEQHRDRADIDDDEQHRDELGPDQHHQPRRVEEGEDQPQHDVHRVARENHHRARTAMTTRGEQVKGESWIMCARPYR